MHVVISCQLSIKVYSTKFCQIYLLKQGVTLRLYGTMKNVYHLILKHFILGLPRFKVWTRLLKYWVAFCSKHNILDTETDSFITSICLSRQGYTWNTQWHKCKPLHNKIIQYTGTPSLLYSTFIEPPVRPRIFKYNTSCSSLQTTVLNTATALIFDSLSLVND